MGLAYMCHGNGGKDEVWTGKFLKCTKTAHEKCAVSAPT